MATRPKPSVATTVRPICSVPVMATPKSRPSKSPQVAVAQAAADQPHSTCLPGLFHSLCANQAADHYNLARNFRAQRPGRGVWGINRQVQCAPALASHAKNALDISTSRCDAHALLGKNLLYDPIDVSQHFDRPRSLPQYHLPRHRRNALDGTAKLGIQLWS